jgi:hypothetical protein
MSVLVFDEKTKQEIAEAIKKARENPVPFEEIQRIARQDPSNKMEYEENRAALAEEVYKKYPTQSLQVGNVQVAFNFEYQPTGLYRHISFAIRKKGKVLDFIPSEMLIKEFGFSGLPPINTYRVWCEEYEPGMHAINVIELVEETTLQ